MRHLYVFTVVFLLYCSPVFGQDIIDGTRLISFPQDTSLTRIPDNLQIWSPEILWEYLSSLNLNYKKDEFETKAEYNERVKIMVKNTEGRAIMDNVSIKDLLVIDFNTFSWDTYEPELGTIRIKVDRDGITTNPIDMSKPNLFREFDCVDLLQEFDYSLLFSKNYKTKVVFQRNNVREFGLAEQNSFCNGCVYMRVPMEKEIAKQSRSMRGLALIKLIPPFYTASRNIIPEQEIYAKLVQFWFYEPESREILAKVKPFTYRQCGGIM